MKAPTCNKDFAVSYNELITEQKDVLMCIDDTYDEMYIPRVPEILANLNKKDKDEYIDVLNDIKYYYNERYDDEDPDCASIILQTEQLLDYLASL